MEKKNIRDCYYKHSKCTYGYQIKYNKEYDYFEGNCSTYYGIVTVYSQGNKENYYHSRFWYVFNGYEYTRSINRRFTRLGLARLAGKFAKEIYTKNKGKKI